MEGKHENLKGIQKPANAVAAFAGLEQRWRKVQQGMLRVAKGGRGSAGPPQQEGTPPEQRSGVLWQAYCALKKQGWEVDAKSYTTDFR